MRRFGERSGHKCREAGSGSQKRRAAWLYFGRCMTSLLSLKQAANLRISVRLGLAFGLTVCLVLAVLGLALSQIRQLHNLAVGYSTNVVPLNGIILDVTHGIDQARLHEAQHLLTNSRDEMVELESKMQQDRARIASSLQAYSRLVSDHGDRTDYEKLQLLVDNYWQQEDKVVALSRNKSDSKAVESARLMLSDSSETYNAVRDTLHAWAEHGEQVAASLADSGARIYPQRTRSLIVLTCCTLTLAALASLRISRSFSGRISQAVQIARSVAQGDLSKRADFYSSDEFGALLLTMDEMSGQLTELITDVFQSAKAVSVTAQEIAQSNEELSERTQQQAASLEETAASMEQITSIGKNNADNARNADQLARDAQRLAETGGSVVSQAVTAMSAINDCSAKISNIISVIDEIAFQTNLLALNAAVEAARAGEQGRGFAVVAAEVRSLAQRSADAAKQIKSLIVDSAEKVQTGTELVDRSGKALSEILNGVRKMTGLISEITGWTHEQAQRVVRVNEVILRLDGATQQNAALVEEGAAASRTLQEQADTMGRRASFFRLDSRLAGDDSAAVSARTSTAGFAAAPMQGETAIRKTG